MRIRLLFPLLVAELRLSAECGSVFVDLVFVPRCLRACLGGAFLLSYHYRASGTSGTVSPAAYPWSFSRSLPLSSSPARDLQPFTWQLRFCLLEVGHRLVLDCFSWHVWSRCSFSAQL